MVMAADCVAADERYEDEVVADPREEDDAAEPAERLSMAAGGDVLCMRCDGRMVALGKEMGFGNERTAANLEDVRTSVLL